MTDKKKPLAAGDRVRVLTGREEFKGVVQKVDGHRVYVTEDGFYSTHNDSPFHRAQVRRLVKKKRREWWIHVHTCSAPKVCIFAPSGEWKCCNPGCTGEVLK